MKDQTIWYKSLQLHPSQLLELISGSSALVQKAIISHPAIKAGRKERQQQRVIGVSHETVRGLVSDVLDYSLAGWHCVSALLLGASNNSMVVQGRLKQNHEYLCITSPAQDEWRHDLKCGFLLLNLPQSRMNMAQALEHKACVAAGWLMAKEKTFYSVYLELRHSFIRPCSAEETNSTNQDVCGTWGSKAAF